MFYVYVLKNIITDKRYVGYTKSLETRFASHQSKAKRKSNKNKFSQAISTYGFSSFTLEFLFPFEEEKEAIRHERLLINFWDTKNLGYNTI